MEIYCALIYFDDGYGGLFKCDVIKKENDYWLVPYWLETTDGKSQIPVRMVGISAFRHQLSIGGSVADIVVNDPIPRDVFEGRARPKEKSGIVVIETDVSGGDNPSTH